MFLWFFDSKNSDFSPSFDRIYPKQGYSKGNVIVISNKANRIKGVKGKDVDHKDGNPMNNSKNNLTVKDKSNNRSFKRNKNAGKA